MKILGVELSSFYDDWPMGARDWYADDGKAIIGRDGRLILDPAETYDLHEQLGFLGWQGRGEVPDYITYKNRRVMVDDFFLERMFKLWRSDDQSVVLKVPPTDMDRLREIAAEHGWEIVV